MEDRRTDRWMDERKKCWKMGRWINGWMNRRKDGMIYGRKDEWVNGWMYR